MEDIIVECPIQYAGRMFMLRYKGEDYMKFVEDILHGCKELIVYKIMDGVYNIFCYFVNAKRFSKTFRTTQYPNIEVYKFVDKTNINTVKRQIPSDAIVFNLNPIDMPVQDTESQTNDYEQQNTDLHVTEQQEDIDGHDQIKLPAPISDNQTTITIQMVDENDMGCMSTLAFSYMFDLDVAERVYCRLFPDNSKVVPGYYPEFATPVHSNVNTIRFVGVIKPTITIEELMRFYQDMQMYISSQYMTDRRGTPARCSHIEVFIDKTDNINKLRSFNSYMKRKCGKVEILDTNFDHIEL